MSEKLFTPEDVLKRRKRDIRTAEERARMKLEQRNKTKGKQEEIYKRPEQFVKQYRNQQSSYAKMRLRSKRRNPTIDGLGDKLLILIRIRGTSNVSTQITKILNRLNLRYLYSASFVKGDKSTLALIKKVEPFLAYGIPSRKIVSDLIYKRAYGKVNGKRIPLTSNKIVEDALGPQGIICLEDLVHEVASCGDNFKTANDFIKCFKLNEPKDGFKHRNQPYHSGGDWGFREDKINELVQKMV